MRTNASQKEYISRINTVLDYVEKHISDELTLDELAHVAGFSKYHFHRVFKSIVNESLYQYILRQRLEKSASLFTHNVDMSITEVAFKFGFSDSAVFARAFKKFYGMSASQYKEFISKKGKVDSNNRKDTGPFTAYNKGVIKNKQEDERMLNVNVEVKVIEGFDLIYIRHLGSYQELAQVFRGLMNKLMNWAGARNLMKMGETKVLAIYHDNPQITEEDKLRTSICLTVPKGTKGEGEIGNMSIPSGKYAIGHFELDLVEFPQAWAYLYGEWLTNSGYQPDDGYSFEVYVNDPNTHPENKHIVDIYLPVKPL